MVCGAFSGLVGKEIEVFARRCFQAGLSDSGFSFHPKPGTTLLEALKNRGFDSRDHQGLRLLDFSVWSAQASAVSTNPS